MIKRLLPLVGIACLISGAAWAQTSGARPSTQGLLDQGRVEEAVTVLRRTLATEPDNGPVCAELVTVLCNSGKADEGMAAVNSCLRRQPREPRLFLARGACNQTRGGFEEAAADYRRAIALNPKNADAHNQLGLILQARGQHQLALQEFSTAIESDPEMLVARSNQATSLIALGRHREAIAMLQTAITRADDLKGLYFYGNLGIAFMKAGMPGQAEAAFLMETAINPDNLSAHLNLGNLYVLRQRYADAIYEYNRVLIADPKNPDALVNLGAAYVMAGDPEEALTYLEPAVRLYPNSALAHHHLGLAYAGIGENGRAAAEAQKAKELGYPPPAPDPAAP